MSEDGENRRESSQPSQTLVPPVLRHLVAVTYAAIDDKGRLLAANDGFRLLLGLSPGSVVDDVSAHIINPPFRAVFGRTSYGSNGHLLHSGLLTFRALNGRPQTLKATVFRRDSYFEVIGEYDVKAYEQLFSTMLHLNEEFADQHRRLTRMGRELERDRNAHADRVDALTSMQDRQLRAKALEAMASLTPGIAHHFNNMLAAMQGFAELARLEFGPREPRLDAYLEQSLSAARRASELVAQLVAFGRLGGTGLPTVAPEPIVERAVSRLRASLPDTMSIDLDAQKPVSFVRIAPEQLEEEMIQLCRNACDAMGDTGRISVGVRKLPRSAGLRCASCQADVEGDYVILSVRDHGPGILEADRPRIFEPFFTTRQRRTGMGLSVVHGTAHFAGGHVLVTAPEDGGAEVSVLLPAVAE